MLIILGFLYNYSTNAATNQRFEMHFLWPEVLDQQGISVIYLFYTRVSNKIKLKGIVSHVSCLNKRPVV